ncbi:MAG: hypothetical protein SZ59_C0002G0084 [candidate division TM6 bacterium GW2011_GWF2_28_16]|nr:MAG: hypothetical protein SZ59_C0002G0084 [candidate division TM6 bacterium GW2011_GWF2_28_16]
MFKPVLVFIQKKKDLQDKVNLKIKKTENNIYDLENQKNKELMYFQQGSKPKYNIEKDLVINIPEQEKYTVNKQEVTSFISKAKDLLVKRVPHVD